MRYFIIFVSTVSAFFLLSCDSGIKRIKPENPDDLNSEENLSDKEIAIDDDKEITNDSQNDSDAVTEDDIKSDDDTYNDNDNGETDPCEGVDCNGKGTCLLDVDDEPYCECDENFYPVVGELLCVNDCVNELGDILSGSPCSHPVNQDSTWSKDCFVASCNPDGQCIGQSAYNGHACTHNLSSSEWDIECYEGVCNDAGCQPVKLSEGTDCDDSVFCNGTEQCSAGGKCVSSGDPCIGGGSCNETCNESEKNCFAPENTSCDDGNPCTGENLCSSEGVCLNGINPCDPQPCTPDPEHDDGYFCCPEGTYGDDCSICMRKVIPSSMLPVEPDGKTWGKAYTDIQAAINDLNDIIGVDCSGGKEIWVAEGKYLISGTITLYSGIKAFGGFNGTESNLAERNWTTNKTVISGENLGTERIINLYSGTIIDGLTLSDSNYEHNNSDRYGGAVLINDGNNIEVRNTVFKNNRIVTNRNGFGGAITVNNSQNIKVINSVFTDNYASEGGGAIYNKSSGLLIERSLFHKNNSNARGGGVHTDDKGNTTITNSIFSGNNAREYGGAVYTRHRDSVSIVTNCSFWGNSITNDGNSSGSTFHNYDRARSDLLNVILWNSINGNPIQNNSSSSANVTYSNIQKGYSGTGNINSDPLFINPENGNFRLESGSPCVNTGNSEGAPDIDFEGTSRPKGSGYDMGAYEQ
jgi:predicted outer membrane repeat protein